MDYKRKAIRGAVGIAVPLALCIASYSAVSVLQPGLIEHWGYSVSQFSLFFSMFSIGGLIMNFFLGKLVPKIGPKLTIIIGSFGPLIAFGGLALSGSLFVAYLVALLYGAMMSMCGFVTYNIFCGCWFNRGRGTMLSIGNTIMYVASIALIPVIASINVSLGIVKTCLTVGISMTAVNLLCGLLLVCQLPFKYGTSAVDIGKAGKAESTVSEIYEPKSSLGKLMKIPALLLCVIVPSVVAVASTMVQPYTAFIYQSFGLEYMQASLVISLGAAFGAVLGFAFGIFSDKAGIKTSIPLCALLSAAFALLAPLFLKGWAACISIALAISLTCFNNMYSGLVCPGFFGLEKSPKVMGWIGTGMSIAGIFAAPFAMAVYNAAGSYSSIMYVFGAIILLSALLNAFILNDKTYRKIREADVESDR